MKKLLVLLIIIGGIGAFVYFFSAWKQTVKENTNVADNFDKTYNYILQKFKGNYPFPTGDLVLLDKNNMMIHLTDRNIPLSSVTGLAVVQGTTCGILQNDKKFQSINYDKAHSLLSGGKVLVKRCFTYSVTADHKNFQIGALIGKDLYHSVASLKGTINKSITKSYDSPFMVKNNSSDYLPYAPVVSPVVLIGDLKKAKLIAKVSDKFGDTKILKLKSSKNPLLSTIGTYDIEIIGKILTGADVKFVDVNGDIIHLAGAKNNKVDFKINNYQLNGKKYSYAVLAGKFIADILKLSPDKDMTVSHRGTTLVIRGTKFTIEANDDEFNTFLDLGHIVQILNGKKIDLTLQHAFSLIKNNKLVKDLEKIKKLVSFTVWADVINNPKYNYQISDLSSSLTSLLTGASNIKRYLVTYENNFKVGLVVLDNKGKDKTLLKIMEKNKKILGISELEAKIKSQYYKKYHRQLKTVPTSILYRDIGNTICEANGFNKGLDISKFWYLLDAKTNDTIVSLKDSFKKQLNLLNSKFLILSSRHSGIQDSIYLGYDSKFRNPIGSITLHKFDNNGTYNKVIFACDAN